jgi:surface antigen
LLTSSYTDIAEELGRRQAKKNFNVNKKPTMGAYTCSPQLLGRLGKRII